jgi:hypothetical protein
MAQLKVRAGSAAAAAAVSPPKKVTQSTVQKNGWTFGSSELVFKVKIIVIFPGI